MNDVAVLHIGTVLLSNIRAVHPTRLLRYALKDKLFSNTHVLARTCSATTALHSHSFPALTTCKELLWAENSMWVGTSTFRFFATLSDEDMPKLLPVAPYICQLHVDICQFKLQRSQYQMQLCILMLRHSQ